MGGGELASTPMPTLTTTPIFVGNQTVSVRGRHPWSSESQYPRTHGTHDLPPDQGWAREYLQTSSSGPATQNDRTIPNPGRKPAHRSMQDSSLGMISGARSGPQLPYIGHTFPVVDQVVGAPEHDADVSEWMGVHRPSGVGLDDVDQVLHQISGELEELAMETGPGREARYAVERGEGSGSRSPPENQTAQNLESETARSRTDQPTAVSHLARKILQAVDHENDEKWKDSSFLELMRDFRDGRKDVSENTIEVVSTK